MWIVNKELTKLLKAVILLLLCLLIAPNRILGGEAKREPRVESVSNLNFILTVHEGLLSLMAEDASIKEIIEEVGRRMSVEVVAQIIEEEKITIAFDKLTLENVLKRLRRYVNIASLSRSSSERGQEKITKIIVFPKSEGTMLSRPTLSESEVKEGVTLEKSENLVRENVKRGSAQSEPFHFKFNPLEFMEKKR